MSEWITGKTPPPNQKPDTTLREEILDILYELPRVGADEGYAQKQNQADQILDTIAKRLPELEKLKKGDPYLESKVSYNQAILEVRAIIDGKDL